VSAPGLEVRVKAELVPDGAAVRVEGGRHGICLARVGDRYFALTDRCSHQSWPLSDGEVDPAGLTVECTKHGSTFSLVDGEPECLPATRPVAVFPVRLEGDEVVVGLT
jgi:3-phenylpropionate/trans-cinnamate dioxygenase ferredoxin subunit